MSGTALYDEADVYDLIHRAGTADEAALLEDLFKLHGNGGRRWLEPACGGGRLLAALARRGWRVCGYDSNPNQAAYAAERLKRFREAEAAIGDMRRFRRPKAFDAAFNLIGTFRHLQTDRDALAHLRVTADSLRRGGIYIIGLDIVDYDQACDDEENWEAGSGRRKLKHTMISLAPSRKTRRERIVNFVEISGAGEKRLIESAYDLRSYDWTEWEALIKRSPFKIAELMTHGMAGGAQDALFVLKLK